ncbi:MAG: hypothetical protein Q7J78_01300 [Clostridiales bacterium]|nr:hypothetical protein [Clostridiales bacterium]
MKSVLDILLFPAELYKRLKEGKRVLVLAALLVGAADLVFYLIEDFTIIKGTGDAVIPLQIFIKIVVFLAIIMLIGALDILLFSYPIFDICKFFLKKMGIFSNLTNASSGGFKDIDKDSNKNAAEAPVKKPTETPAKTPPENAAENSAEDVAENANKDTDPDKNTDKSADKNPDKNPDKRPDKNVGRVKGNIIEAQPIFAGLNNTGFIKIAKIYAISHFIIIPAEFLIFFLFRMVTSSLGISNDTSSLTNGSVTINAALAIPLYLAAILDLVLPFWFSAAISRGISTMYKLQGLIKPILFIVIVIWNRLIGTALTYVIKNWIVAFMHTI